MIFGAGPSSAPCGFSLSPPERAIFPRRIRPSLRTSSVARAVVLIAETRQSKASGTTVRNRNLWVRSTSAAWFIMPPPKRDTLLIVAHGTAMSRKPPADRGVRTAPTPKPPMPNPQSPPLLIDIDSVGRQNRHRWGIWNE